MAAYKLLRSLIIVILSYVGKTQYINYTDTSNTAGTFKSPNHPGVYPSDTNYTVVVKVDHVRLFNITIYNIDIEQNDPKLCYDYLKLYKGSEINRETRLIGPICGDRRYKYIKYVYDNADDGCTVATDRASVTCQLLSRGFTMYFHTDTAKQLGGFEMTYTSRRATPSAICDAIQRVNYASSMVTYVYFNISILISDSKLDYLSNLNCEWFLPNIHSNSLHFVLITVYYLSIGHCEDEKLQIWDMANSTNSTEKALTTLCGSREPFQISLYNVPHGLRVTYVSNTSINCGDFHLDIQVKKLRNSYARQHILVTDFTMHHMSIYGLSKQFPFCINNYNYNSYCHYIVQFVTEHGYQIHLTMSPDLIGHVSAFDGPSVEYRPLMYGEPNFKKEMFGWRSSNLSKIGFLSVGPYLTILLNRNTMNSSALLYYHMRAAFSSLNHRFLNCQTPDVQTAKLGIFNLNAIMSFFIKRRKREAHNYVCYIVLTVVKHLALSVKIRNIEYVDQIGEKCQSHGIVVYDGSVNSHNKLGPYCELEKGYMKALFDPLVTASNRVYLMMYMYAKEGDGPQSIIVDITATRCTGVHVIPAVFRESGVLNTYNVVNETLVKSITYTPQTRCMTVIFHADIDNAFYLYNINELDQVKLSIREYVWISCFNNREKLLQMNKSFFEGIQKTTTIFNKQSYTDIRFVKVYIGDNDEHTPQLLGVCYPKSYVDDLLNFQSVFQGFIDFSDGQSRMDCFLSLSSGSDKRTIISAHYFEMYIHRYRGDRLSITEYMDTLKTFYRQRTLYEIRGKEFLITHQRFLSVSTKLLILDLGVLAVMNIEYQAMAYQHVPVMIQDRVQINNHYYEFVMFPKTIITAKTAQDICASGGGNLFSASTLEELEAIKSAITHVWAGHIRRGEYFRMDILIGLHKLDGTTQWRWTDGSPLTITDWYYPDMSHGIPQQFQSEGDAFTVQPSDHAWYQCGMMEIYSPQQSTNWRTIDCNEEVPTTASNVAYICEYQHPTTVDATITKTDVTNANKATDSTNLHRYEQLSTNHTCTTDWTFMQDRCWLLVNSYLELLSYDNMTIHYCDKYGGQLASVDNIEIVKRYLTYIQHHEPYGSIWVMSRGKPSCVQYGFRNDLRESEDERLEIVEASKCVISTQFEYDGWFPDQYKQFLNQYYPVHCQKGINYYRAKKYSVMEVNITCSPNHVFCVRDVVPVTITCDVGYLQCADTSCVSPDLVCDGVDDCKTGEDEQGCELPDYWYNCSTPNITISKYYDFFPDCSDGSDEEGCVFPPCSGGQFRCDSGQCVDEMRWCNGRHDGCIDNSDETHCKSRANCTNGFYCGDGTCIPKEQENDGRIDCPSKRDEPYISRYYKVGNLTDYINCSAVEGRCTETSVGCFNRGEACVLGYYTDGRMKSCSNGAHLYNCSTFECPGRYKCPESYCIDMKRVCNGIQDCQDNEDEAECDDTHSPGLYRCGGDQTYSIDRLQVCDGEFDCARHHSDEKYCSLPECHRGCTCRGFYYNCEWNLTNDVSITEANFSVYARTINLANNNLSTTNMFVFTRYSFLAVLRLSSNQIEEVNNATFAGLYNLIILDLSHNMLTSLGQNTFKHLSRLEHLLVHGNLIKIILSETFNGLSSVVMLNLSSLSISEVKAGALNGLTKLKILDLSANGIRLIEQGVFDSGQQLTRVILTGNKMDDVPSDVFGAITADFIETDAFRFCCFTNKSILINCTAEFGTYSSCDDLMSNRFLQIIIWVIGCLAVIGNVAVIICRPIIGIKTASEICIFALSCSDLLTGVYLMILASVDTHYRGRYIIHDVEWRESVLCELCGVLGTLSAQLSSFLLLLITLDRFIRLVFPLKGVSYSRKFAIVVCMVVFTVSLIESVIPIGIESYFDEKFYSKTALCLAYDFNDISDGWEYTLVVFILVNLLNCVITLVCYIIIYCSIHRSSQKADPRRKADVALAKTLFLLVLTDLACWFPLIITSLAVYAGHKVSRDMAAILAVIVLPINAAINPYLYTISTIQNARSRRQTCRHTKQTDSQISQTKITAHSRQTQPQSSQMSAEPWEMVEHGSQKEAETNQKTALSSPTAVHNTQTPKHDSSFRQLVLQIRDFEVQNRLHEQPTKHLESQITKQTIEQEEENMPKKGQNSTLTEHFRESTEHSGYVKDQTIQPEANGTCSHGARKSTGLEAENRHLSEQNGHLNHEVNRNLNEQINHLNENITRLSLTKQFMESNGCLEDQRITPEAHGTGRQEATESMGLEEENRHLNEQIRHVSEQNMLFTERNRQLNEKITHLTKQFMESNERLEDQTRQLETEMSWMMTQISELGARNRHLNEQITEQNMELTEQNTQL